MKLKILLIEGDRQYEKLIKNLLSDRFQIKSVSSFSEGYTAVLSLIPDIVIIDPLFPKNQGLKFISDLRERSNCPIMAISFNGTERAASEIMTAGADDFIRKPFFSKEFLARVERCVRHIELLETAMGMDKSDFYIYNDLKVDFISGQVTKENKKIRLTKGEFQILSLLCRNSGKVLTYDSILKSLWGPSAGNNTGVLRVNITNLRRKIETDPKNPQYILTENGVGYTIGHN